MTTAVDEFPGRAGFYVKDLNSGAVYEHRADERFPTASVFKVSVMVTLFQLVESGRVSLGDRHRVAPDISTHGTGVLRSFYDQPELTLHDHCRVMIGASDNMATDTIIRAVGTDAINDMLAREGLSNTRVPMEIGRWHYMIVGMDDEPISRANDERQLQRCRRAAWRDDGVGYSDSLENLVASPRDMGILLERLHRGELAGPQSTAAMIEMLQSSGGMIMAPLKSEVAAKVASKKGSSRRIKADVGIAYLSTGPLIISGLTLEHSNAKLGGPLIENIARLAVRTLEPGALAEQEA